MRDLAKSMMRFSWAAGVFGASQAAAWVRPSRGPEPSDRPTSDRFSGLDAVTWATRGELGELGQAFFQAGEDLQDDWAEMLGRVLGGTMRPWLWRQTARELAERSATALRFASPGPEGEVIRQELKNKFEVYGLVKGGRKLIGLPADGGPFELRPAVEQAARLGEFRALWVIEGLGHDYAAQALRRGRRPSGLLRGRAVLGLSSGSLQMLHGGLGLACAEHVLRELRPDSTASQAAAATERFVGLCRDNATERYVDSALEALGLDARCFFPDLVPVLESGFERSHDRRSQRIFWHGVGRAIYFLPVNFIPGHGSFEHAVGMVKRASPHQLAHDNALAGVSYAFAMVNMANPAILESILQEQGEALRDTPFADGLAAALAMRHAITPNAAVLRGLIDHRPLPPGASVWETLVRRPCRRVLASEPASDDDPITVAEVYRALPLAGVEG